MNQPTGEADQGYAIADLVGYATDLFAAAGLPVPAGTNPVRMPGGGALGRTPGRHLAIRIKCQKLMMEI